ncbi:MAG TPA: response regulator [Spirochaetes bacterium]|nr:response regulator [Spirochaetota bacterium]
MNTEAKKVLIVDDEADVLEYLSSLLEDNGYRTLTAMNGKTGMEAARAEKPDLICLDITMPEETGVSMLRQLHDDGETASIPVIIVSGVDPRFKDFIENRRQVSPPAAYFEKPINQGEFLAAVKKTLA